MVWVLKEVWSGGLKAENPDTGFTVEIYNSPTTSYNNLSFSGPVNFTVQLSNHRYDQILELFDSPDWQDNPWALLLIFVDGFSERQARDYQRTICSIIENIGHMSLAEAIESGEIVVGSYWVQRVIKVREPIEKMFRKAVRSIKAKRYDGWESIIDIKKFRSAAERLREHVPKEFKEMIDEVIKAADIKLVKIGLD